MPKPHEIITFKAEIGTKARVLRKAAAHRRKNGSAYPANYTDYFLMREAEDNILEQ